ncbi:MAG: HlyD family efflux transporter periplasmic adaptor subunit [Proteobacteria bacterium]|nr:HlyD family efflux transporter periplasmic adaptor subunit [Pseudomonadota bacterium]
MIYEVTQGDNVLTVEVERNDAGYRVVVDGTEHQVGARKLGDVLHLLVGERSVDAGIVRRPNGWDVDLRGQLHECHVVDPRRKALRLAAGGGSGAMTASMPGRVVRLLVEVGASVTKGTPVMVVEAMKMENEVKAPIDGVVTEIHVEAGQAVDAGASLMQVEADGP